MDIPQALPRIPANHSMLDCALLHPSLRQPSIKVQFNTHRSRVQDVQLQIPRPRSDRWIGGTIQELLTHVHQTSQGDVSAHQLGFVEAFEQLYDISDKVPENVIASRSLVVEWERVWEHGKWFVELTSHAGLEYIANRLKKTLNLFNRAIQQAVGTTIPQLGTLFEVGTSQFKLTVNNIDALKKANLETQHRLKNIRQELLFNPRFRSFFAQVGVLDTRSATYTGAVGVVARSSGIGGDLRITDPYWSYIDNPIRPTISHDQDLWGIVRVRLAEMAESLRFSLALLEAAEPIEGGGEKDDSFDVGSLDGEQEGRMVVRLENSRGPTLYNLSCARGGEVTAATILHPCVTNLASLAHRLRGVPTRHIGRIIHAYNLTSPT